MKNLLFLFAPQMESYNSNGAMNGDGSSNAPISDNREGVTNVINPNVPVKFSHFTKILILFFN